MAEIVDFRTATAPGWCEGEEVPNQQPEFYAGSAPVELSQLAAVCRCAAVARSHRQAPLRKRRCQPEQKKKANRCSDRHHERASLPRRRASQCQQRKTITWFWLHDLQGQSDSLAGGGLLEQQPQGLRRPTTTHRGVCDRGQKKIEDAAGTLQKTCTQGAGRQRHRRRQGEGQGQRNGRGRRGSGSCRCCRSHEEEENQKEEKC
mmetsp:Transcript_62636/g.168325  ORF Transcript_62636/g.168325 Transcript_62636/m.168325 type:complete len:204 (-) Transcript_62636:204-815(-)